MRNEADISFIHDALPHSLTHIRLLEVLPQVSQADNLIRCRLINARLSDPDQSYTAISYAWQHNTPEQIIKINSRSFKVKENVYHVLHRHRQRLLRHEVSAVFLWIDAICLDSSNLSERNAQTTLMPNIFQKAKDVLICLESRIPAPTISAYSLEQLGYFFKQVQQDLQAEICFSKDQQLSKTYIRQDLQNACAEKHTNEWATMLQICQQSYWSRLWILLETRHAQKLQIMYAASVWSWESFRSPFILAKCLEEHHDLDGSLMARILNTIVVDVLAIRSPSWHDLSPAMPCNRYIDFVNGNDSFVARQPLSDLVKKYRRQICDERLDRIYALIGLADTSLSVDYSRSNIELFCAVLLSLRISPELSFVSMLAEQLGVSAFEYKQNRRSILYGLPPSKQNQTAADMTGHTCQNVLSVRLIPARTEILDVLQTRLGSAKLKLYQLTSQKTLQNMNGWDDMQEIKADLPRLHGHVPGASMPIVDGFDLSHTAFRPAIFLNSSQRNYKRKMVFGMLSTSDIQPGDILVTDDKMYAGLIVRISGLRKTWLTVVGVILFVRRVTVESDCSITGLPNSPTATVRSTSLSDFCEHTLPTPFTITTSENHEQFTLKPHEMQVPSLFAGSSFSSGRHSRASSNATNSTKFSPSRTSSRRLVMRSDRIDRLMDVINPMKRRMTK